MFRAFHPEDKELRRDSLLDAAERLWLQNADRLSSVEDIAREAGVAKGTVYLYFASKETLFLALHARQTMDFFHRVTAHSAEAESMQVADLNQVLVDFLQDYPSFLPLASMCHGMLERQIPLETGFEFERQTHEQLEQTVLALKAHFPMVTQALMLQSYALILGLWQLVRPTPLKQLMKDRELDIACTGDYLPLLTTALNRLWEGAAAELDT